MSGRLRARALGLMRQLDAGGGYRDQIAKEVEQRLTRSEGDGLSHRQDPATAEAVVLRTCDCGTENDPDAKFCKNCGAKL